MNKSTQPPATKLPTIADRPTAALVIFDGECGFCQQQVHRLNRWDRNGQLAYISLHDPWVGERFPDLTHEQLMQQLFVVTPEGLRFGGADAFRYFAHNLASLSPISILLRIPGAMPLCRFVYGRFAKHRYRISKHFACTSDTCEIHVR